MNTEGGSHIAAPYFMGRKESEMPEEYQEVFGEYARPSKDVEHAFEPARAMPAGSCYTDPEEPMLGLYGTGSYAVTVFPDGTSEITKLSTRV